MNTKDDLADAFRSSFTYLCDDDEDLPGMVADFILEQVDEEVQQLRADLFDLQRQIAELTDPYGE